MVKTLIGPRLRQLRRERKQTQAEMAKQLGVSASYVNLLENNQRSLSVQMLMNIADTYAIDWRDLTQDESTRHIADLRNAVQDPVFNGEKPDLQEIRGAIDHAPRLVDNFLQLYDAHRSALEKLMTLGGAESASELLKSSPEALIHDFFRDHRNHFPDLESAAENAWNGRFTTPENRYAELRDKLKDKHGIQVEVRRIGDMGDALRYYDEAARVVYLSQALNNSNQVFQLAHVLCVVEFGDIITDYTEKSGFDSPQALTRLRVELANYFAAAYLMPYDGFLAEAETTGYDMDRIAAAFGTSFEQVCQRVTTLQREGARGVPFFFMRIDKAGNVTKRFNSTSFHLAEHGGSCPVWNIHTAFYTPGVIMPQFVEMPDGDRYFTISRTVHRPVFSEETQDRRLTLALGCEAGYAHRIRYASRYNFDDPQLYAPIGINCHLCPRQACTQRAHQPLFTELPMDENRRGSTRYES
ncbi:helix-turn-helix domain-containing protein [Chachezhania antarctica]|uniref:helix-turn-helix domain-containing protein n=1 Tax=Chachezhania antarctica TaxID=2340860 RepID=UPI000EAD6BE1|nr:helix-turn-helix transcriptional regulator [Chachezhania antarctica]